MSRLPCFFACAFLAPVAVSHAQNFVDILPGTNNVPISSVAYSIDGSIVTQTSEATGVSTRRNGSVFVQSVNVNDGGTTKSLNAFNTLGGVVRNVNLTSSTFGVGVFDNGVKTTTSDLSAFSSSLAGITQDTDLLNYSYYDGSGNLPNSSTSDYDLLFARGFESNDFILVSERDGNTFFSVVPLDINGNVISGANTLRFGGATTLGTHLAYDWNSGYASETYIDQQSFGFSVAKVDKFFENTQISSQTVFGFRIDNNGDADVKFFGLSDTSFANNPHNPGVLSTVPEPSTAVLSLLGLLAAFRRRR